MGIIIILPKTVMSPCCLPGTVLVALYTLYVAHLLAAKIGVVNKQHRSRASARLHASVSLPRTDGIGFAAPAMADCAEQGWAAAEESVPGSALSPVATPGLDS